MAIIKSGEYHDPNKHETLKLTDKDRRTVSQFTHELVSPLRPESHPSEDDAHIAAVEFNMAIHELGPNPDMRAVRLIELSTAGALTHLGDAQKLFENALDGLDETQKQTLQDYWSATYQARAHLPHARTETEKGTTYAAFSRMADVHAMKHKDDKRLGTYLAAFAAGLTRKSQFGQMHADQLDQLMDPR